MDSVNSTSVGNSTLVGSSPSSGNSASSVNLISEVDTNSAFESYSAEVSDAPVDSTSTSVASVCRNKFIPLSILSTPMMDFSATEWVVPETSVTDEIAPEILASALDVISESRSLEELVFRWVDGSRGVHLCCGIADSSGGIGHFLELYHDSKLVAAAAIHPDVMVKDFSSVEPFDDSTDCTPPDAVYNEDFCDFIFPRERAISVAVSFLKTGRGEVRFDVYDSSYSLEELLPEDRKKYESVKFISLDYAICNYADQSSSHWLALVLEPVGESGELKQ